MTFLLGVLGIGGLAWGVSSALGMLPKPMLSLLGLGVTGWLLLVAVIAMWGRSETWGGYLDDVAQLKLACAAALLASVMLLAGYANGRRAAGRRAMAAAFLVGGLVVSGVAWLVIAASGWTLAQDSSDLSRTAHAALEVPRFPQRADEPGAFHDIAVQLGCDGATQVKECVVSERYRALSTTPLAWVTAAGTFVFVLAAGIAFRESSSVEVPNERFVLSS